MKCIRCQSDCKFKERSDKRCPKCHGEFAFEPRTGALLSDMAFKHAIDHVSSGGQVRWGVENLYYEICRRKRYGKILGWIVGLFGTDPLLVRVPQSQFEGMWQCWLKVHGQPEGVIVRKPRPAAKRSLEPDIADYSFDRAVICDRARTVDILLANNYHFENNCAVLSVEGYPAGPFETVLGMLKRNPKLQVFALHDCTPVGCRLAHRLATDPQWFAGQTRVVDVGLRPIHATPFRGTLIRSDDWSVEAGRGIGSDETKWLSTYALELAVIRPEQVLKRLFRAMNRQFDPAESTDTGSSTSTGGDGGGYYAGDVYTDSDAFGTDATASDGGGDSFG